jgi:hypothetical protein
MIDDQSARQTTVGETDDELGEDRDAGDGNLQQAIRALAADLVHDILAAVASASAAELGELIRFAQQNRARDSAHSNLDRAAPRPADPRPGASFDHAAPEVSSGQRERAWKPRAIPRGGERSGPQRAAREAEVDLMAHAGPSDPFDITSPHELLASTDEPSVQPPQASADSPDRSQDLPRSTALPSLLQQPATESSTALVEGDSDAASERRPKVVLRAGERLLSATGSGVVIGRERRER